MFWRTHHPNGASVLNGCECEDQAMPLLDLSGHKITCHASFDNADLCGASFDGIFFEGESSLSFNNVNLRDTSWIDVPTSRIHFNNVDLNGSNITLKQLAIAGWVSQDSTFPVGIDYRAIADHRAQLKLPAFKVAEPALA